MSETINAIGFVLVGMLIASAALIYYAATHPAKREETRDHPTAILSHIADIINQRIRIVTYCDNVAIDEIDVLGALQGHNWQYVENDTPQYHHASFSQECPKGCVHQNRLELLASDNFKDGHYVWCVLPREHEGSCVNAKDYYSREQGGYIYA